jgi:hypothetical protein
VTTVPIPSVLQDKKNSRLTNIVVSCKKVLTLLYSSAAESQSGLWERQGFQRYKDRQTKNNLLDRKCRDFNVSNSKVAKRKKIFLSNNQSLQSFHVKICFDSLIGYLKATKNPDQRIQNLKTKTFSINQPAVLATSNKITRQPFLFNSTVDIIPYKLQTKVVNYNVSGSVGKYSDPVGQLITDLFGSGSYLVILVTICFVK